MTRFPDMLSAVAPAVLVRAYLALIPFAYAMQVVSGIREFALVAYLPLLAAAAAHVTMSDFGRFKYKSYSSVPWLLLGIAFLAMHNSASTLSTFLRGEYGLGFRSFFFFVLPFAVVAIARDAPLQVRFRFLQVIAFCAMAVAMEMLFENVSTRVLGESTWFQLKNKAYVLNVSGRSLSQLYLPTYRPTGLLEHLHATVFFVGVGSLASLALYVRNGQRRFLLMLLVTFTAILQHGVRIPLAGLLLAFAAACQMMWNAESSLQRDSLRAAISALLGITAFCLAIDPLGVAQQYYWPALIKGDFQTTDPVVETAVRSYLTVLTASDWGRLLLGMKDYSGFHAMLGLGIASSLEPLPSNTDDLFFLQVFSQYGLLGTAVFFGTLLLAFLSVGRSLRQGNSEGRPMAAFLVPAMFLLVLSMLHSGAIQRKAVYPIFMLTLGLAAACGRAGDRVVEV